MKVLVVEDDTVSRELICAQLKKLTYDPVPTRNGKEAWDSFQAADFRLVITDWMMPVMDGLELTRRIRAEKQRKYTYVVLVTAVDRTIGFLEGLNAGADDFISKPSTIEELQIRLRVADRILALQSEAQQLSRLLPLCPKCKRIHNGNGHWQQAESYLMRRTEAQFSHGICPDCVEKVLKPQLERYQEERRRAAGG